MKEVWKDIEEYEGLYQVSNYGNVKSLNYNHTKKEKILKIDNSSNKGYSCVRLCKDKIITKKTIHRLVAKAFVSNPENKPQVNHIDGNKLNNYANNLEWVTNGENEKHAYNYNLKHKHFGKNNGRAKSIVQYDLQGNFVREYETIIQAQRETGLGQTTILYILKNKTKKPTKFIFKYKEEKNGDN